MGLEKYIPERAEPITEKEFDDFINSEIKYTEEAIEKWASIMRKYYLPRFGPDE